MTSISTDLTALRRLIPEGVIGEVEAIAPIRGGLSGAHVYTVSTSRGEFVLRTQPRHDDERFWPQYRTLLRRASAAGVAPEVVHVDEASRAVVFRRVAGAPFHLALREPALRGAAIADLVGRLRAVHTIDPTGIAERDPIAFAREVWEVQRRRPGFPAWAVVAESVFDNISQLYTRDRRRVVSHNDVNPGNVLWDGSRTWLVDWDAAGLSHQYYDLAAFVTFLGLDDEQAYALLAMQEQSPLDDDARALFRALRQLVGLAIGYSFVSMVPELAALAQTRADAPTMADFHAARRRGEVDLLTVEGRATYGLAILRAATDS